MVTFARASLVLLLATGGCTHVPLDYTRTDDASADGLQTEGDGAASGSPDAMVDAPSGDEGPASGDESMSPRSAMPEAGGDAGSGPPCPCNSEMTGQYCCIPPGAEAPFCTSDGTSCTAASGIFVFCQSYDPQSASQCCWNDSPSAGGAALYASSCGMRPVACVQSSDCVGQTCNTAVCKGVTIGSCGVSPVCP